MASFNSLPNELWSLIFKSIDVKTLRLIDKTFGYYFESRFYKSISIKINKKDIYQVMLNNDKYIYRVNHDINYLVNNDIKMYQMKYLTDTGYCDIYFNINYNDYIDQFKKHRYPNYNFGIKATGIVRNMNIDILNRYIIVKNRYGNMYYKYHNIVKDKIIQYIKSENIAIYSSSLYLIISCYVNLLFNAYIFDLVTIDDINNIINHLPDNKDDLRYLCKDLTIKIIGCINNIDKDDV